jgi:type IV pilus assembly protein PilO
MANINQQIAEAPQKFFLVGGLVVGLLYYFMVFDSGSKIEEEIAAIETEMQKDRKALADAQAAAKEKDKFQQEVTQTNNQLQAALEYLPKDQKVEEINIRLEEEARRAGVRIRKFLPQKSELKQFYEEFPVDIIIEGSFTNVTLFLSYITQLKRIITIKGFDIAKSASKSGVDSGNNLSLQGTLVVYRYLETK